MRSMYKTMQQIEEKKKKEVPLILSRIKNQRKWPNGGGEGKKGVGQNNLTTSGSLTSITYVSAQLQS